MAPESCNLGKDEAEILKPSSPKSSPSPSSASSSSLASTSASPSPPSAPSPLPTSLQFPSQQPSCFLLEPPHETELDASDELPSPPKPDKGPSLRAFFVLRCSTCHKRLGLAGFRCRCGDLYCARHRYSDTHDCSFDYKAAGRAEISKANPVIRAAKIIKI